MGTGIFCLSFSNTQRAKTHSQNTHPCPTLCKEGGKVLRGEASGPDQRDSVLRAQDPRTAGYDTEGEPGAVAATQLHVSGPFPSLSEQTYPANFKGPTLTGGGCPHSSGEGGSRAPKLLRFCTICGRLPSADVLSATVQRSPQPGHHLRKQRAENKQSPWARPASQREAAGLSVMVPNGEDTAMVF